MFGVVWNWWGVDEDDQTFYLGQEEICRSRGSRRNTRFPLLRHLPNSRLGSVFADLLSATKEGFGASSISFGATRIQSFRIFRRGFEAPFSLPDFSPPSNGMNCREFFLLRLCTNRPLEWILVTRGIYSKEESCYDFLCSPPFYLCGAHFFHGK